jgi:hypothetical protein
VLLPEAFSQSQVAQTTKFLCKAEAKKGKRKKDIKIISIIKQKPVGSYS